MTTTKPARIPDRILRRDAIEAITGLSIRTIERREKLGEFPRRVRLGPTAVGWRESEVLAWMDGLERGNAAEPTAATAAQITARRHRVG